MLVLTFLGACGWWERHQACRDARDAESKGWTSLETALEAAADAARAQADASLAAAQAVDTAQGAAGDGAAAAPAVSRGELAQDAFTRASRAYGTDQGLAAATWTDWSVRTQDQVTDADRRVDQARAAIERLGLWTRALSDSTLAVELVSTRHEAGVLDEAGHAGLRLALVVPPTADDDDADAQARAAAVEAAVAAHALRTDGLAAALAAADRLAFDVDRAGKTAAAAAASYPYLGFPPEAQVAQAAALAADAAARRATEAATKLAAAAAAARQAPDPAPPADVEAALAQATGFAQARAAACE